MTLAGEKLPAKGLRPRKRIVVTQPEQKLSGKVESTGGWETFVDVKLGTLIFAERPPRAFRQADEHAARRGDESEIDRAEAGEAVTGSSLPND